MTPADKIIHELVTTLRLASTDEVQSILAHVAKAPFATYLARVPNDLRQHLTAQGILTAPKLPSVEWHLLKRVYQERQWPEGTSVKDYLADLQQGVQHPAVSFWIYRYFQRPYASFLAPANIRHAPRPLPYLFVAYDPEFGTITTGYQASGYATDFDSHCTDLVRHR